MQIKRKKSMNWFIVLSIILSLLIPATSSGVELPLKAESAILIDAQSGKVLYEKEPDKVLYPASMTKLMTLVIAMEALEQGKVKMNDMVTASENAASFGGSQIFLSPGEKLTLYDIILGVALASGNDASVALAEHIAGSHEGFVELMNKKAEELGMKNTHFVNCNGLHDPNHVTTAADFAKLGLYALTFPELRKICTVKHYRIRENTRPFQYDNKNKLLWWYEGTDGFKTGWTSDSKYCFTGTVERNGLRFVSVVMGVPVAKGHFADTRVLWNWGYSQFIFKEFYKEKEPLGTVKVGKGVNNQVEAVPDKKVGITVAKGADKNITAKVELIPLVNAPVKKGQVVGTVAIVQDNNILEKTNLIAGEDVAKGSWLGEFKKVLRATVTGYIE